MPMHDWTRVDAGVYHDFHTTWIVAIRSALNRGILPAGYFARAEQVTRTMSPDVVALEASPQEPPTPPASTGRAATRVRYRAAAEPRPVKVRQRRVGIRRGERERLVAIIELVSPGNKAARYPVGSFVGKVVRAVHAGVHVLFVDPFPPGNRDPHGMHGLVWAELGGGPFELPPGQPLTLAAYEAADPAPRCYVEPFAVGQPLADMPLFLKPGFSVDVPLEATYQAAWAEVLPQDRAALEAP